MRSQHWPVKRSIKVLFPVDSLDWKLVPYQPLLFTALWLSVIALMIWGDVANIPDETGGNTGNVFARMPIVWIVLLLTCPPMGLLSSWMIVIQRGVWRYRGFWLRLIADVGVTTALLAYLVARFTVGDYHLIPVATLGASTVFACALVRRDILTLAMNERLATKIQRASDAADQEKEESI